jgi:hypothetical protein
MEVAAWHTAFLALGFDHEPLRLHLPVSTPVGREPARYRVGAGRK